MQRILRAMKSSNTFENVQSVLHAKVPIIRSRHRQLHIEIDISLHNMLVNNYWLFFRIILSSEYLGN
jgi:DNA polymerase sigma